MHFWTEWNFGLLMGIFALQVFKGQVFHCVICFSSIHLLSHFSFSLSLSLSLSFPLPPSLCLFMDYLSNSYSPLICQWMF